MKLLFPTVNKLILLSLLFTQVFALSGIPIAAETVNDNAVWAFSADTTLATQPTYTNECVIPDSGPWPPCATGDNGNDDCIIPPTGPWPPCATGGDDGAGQGQPCPVSGPWPPNCVPSGNSADGTCVIPESGPWPPCATNPSGGNSIDARLNTALQQLDTYWYSELTWRGVTPIQLQTFEIYDGAADQPPNAFYVPAEDAIYIDRRLLDYYVATIGEYAAVAILVHEYSHFIQDTMGLLVRSTPVRTLELQADCLTGSFTGHLRDINVLRPGEYEEGGDMLFSVGDDQLSPGEEVPPELAHGDGHERRGAYDLGYFNSAQTCFDANY